MTETEHAVAFLGIGFMQNYYLKDPGLPSEHYTIELTWLVTLMSGILGFTYGVIGFWFCERRRKFWRIGLHRLPPSASYLMVVFIQLVMVGLNIAALLSIIFVEKDKIGDHLIWVILIVIGIGLYKSYTDCVDKRFLQQLVVWILVSELVGLYKHKKLYEDDMEGNAEKAKADIFISLPISSSSDRTRSERSPPSST
jgi:hypothetical protein